MAADRIARLEWALQVATESIEEAPAYARAALLKQHSDILRELAELTEADEPTKTEGEVSGLASFQAALAQRRQPNAKAARNAASR